MSSEPDRVIPDRPDDLWSPIPWDRVARDLAELPEVELCNRILMGDLARIEFNRRAFNRMYRRDDEPTPTPATRDGGEG